MVLQQEGHPIAYLSKALGPRTKGLLTYEKEYLAMVLVVDQWRAYLQFSEFIIKTDQKSLVHLEEQRLHTPWQQKAFTKLLGLQYHICYRKGSENSAADALSRRPINPSQQVNAVSVCQPAWLQEVTQGYVHDPKAQQLITQLALAPVAGGKFTYQQGVLRFRGRVWLGTNVKMQTQITRPCMTVRSAAILDFPQHTAESSNSSRGRA